MALTKPILYSISAFDATESQTFNFNVVGGDQVVKNQLIITNQSDNSIVYQGIETTFAFRHVLPANILTNGQYYSAVLITYNINDDASIPSSGIQFYCFTEPTFEFDNIPATNLITNATYSFEAVYNQNENEVLNSYIFNLYDSHRNLLNSSGILYVGGTSVLPIVVSHAFTGLNDDTIYYVQVTGQTMHGMSVDTGLVIINVEYETPNIFSIIELSNNCKGGYITIRSNLIAIDGNSSPEPPNYVDNNTAVDVTGNGEYIVWDTGYSINGDYTISLWGRDFNEDSTIISISDGMQNLTINYRKDENDLYYAELIIQENFMTYYIYSNPIAVQLNDKIQIWLRRIGYLYDVGLYNLE